MDPRQAVDLNDYRGPQRGAAPAPSAVLELLHFGIGVAPTPAGCMLIIVRPEIGEQLRVPLREATAEQLVGEVREALEARNESLLEDAAEERE